MQRLVWETRAGTVELKLRKGSERPDGGARKLPGRVDTRVQRPDDVSRSRGVRIQCPNGKLFWTRLREPADAQRPGLMARPRIRPAPWHDAAASSWLTQGAQGTRVLGQRPRPPCHLPASRAWPSTPSPRMTAQWRQVPRYRSSPLSGTTPRCPRYMKPVHSTCLNARSSGGPTPSSKEPNGTPSAHDEWAIQRARYYDTGINPIQPSPDGSLPA